MTDDEEICSISLRDAAAVAMDIRSMPPDGIVALGPIHPAALAHWPNRTTNETVLTAERYSHIVESHPDRTSIPRFEERIVETVRMPKLAYRDQQSPNVVNLLIAIDVKYDLFVSIVLSSDNERANSVLSARKQPARLRHRDRLKGLVVWRNEE
mgnify:FL=1